MTDRWSTAEVLALAPDAAVGLAAHGLATPSAWSDVGCDDIGVWGLYRGTSAEPYDVVVDRIGPAWRCSCPSRKIPCKHAVGLLLLWAEGNVPSAVRPANVRAWLAAQQRRAAPSSGREAEPELPLVPAEAPGPAPATREEVGGPAPRERAGDRRADDRASRVRAGLAELDLWLTDQVRRGLTSAELARADTWEGVASRLVDAQAPALANRVRRVAELVGGGVGWQERVLAEMAGLHALAVAGAAPSRLDDDLAVSVRTAVGWAVSKEEVLAGTPVTDDWHVVARSDTDEHRIIVRRTWLLGRRTGRWGLLLSFAAFGQSLAGFPAVGTLLHADLHHFPGRLPIRALVGRQHEPAVADVDGPAASSVAATLADHGWAVAQEPWLERWPGVVRGTPARATGPGWVLADESGGLALAPGAYLPTLLAVSGGGPVVVAGEHRANGFAPLAVRVEDRAAVLA